MSAQNNKKAGRYKIHLGNLDVVDFTPLVMLGDKICKDKIDGTTDKGREVLGFDKEPPPCKAQEGYKVEHYLGFGRLVPGLPGISSLLVGGINGISIQKNTAFAARYTLYPMLRLMVILYISTLPGCSTLNYERGIEVRCADCKELEVLINFDTETSEPAEMPL